MRLILPVMLLLFLLTLLLINIIVKFIEFNPII